MLKPIVKQFLRSGKLLVLAGFMAFLGIYLHPSINLFIRNTFFEFQAPAWHALSQFKDLEEFWFRRAHSKNDLIEAGIALARLNAAYELRLQQYDNLREDVQRLEAFFEMPSLPQYRYEVARVARRDINAWWQRIIIRKGHHHGIEEGMAVVYSGGVVGRVVEVHAYLSAIELVSSPNFRMVAHFEGDNRPVTYQGRENHGFGDPFGSAYNVPMDVDPNPTEPLRLSSSRLGGVFPDGLTIGYVSSFEPSRGGLFQRGKVTLDERLCSIREVAVLIPITGEVGRKN